MPSARLRGCFIVVTRKGNVPQVGGWGGTGGKAGLCLKVDLVTLVICQNILMQTLLASGYFKFHPTQGVSCPLETRGL